MGAERKAVAGSSKRVPRKSAKKSAERPVKMPIERPIKMIVRRGATPRFEALQRKTKHLNVQVVWDRREDDSQATPNEQVRKHGNRRAAPPFTWDAADFLVVVPATDEEPTT